MPIAYGPHRHVIVTDLDWPTRDAPDALAAGRASFIQHCCSVEEDDPVGYIMDAYGETREQAEAIVKNCRTVEE